MENCCHIWYATIWHVSICDLLSNVSQDLKMETVLQRFNFPCVKMKGNSINVDFFVDNEKRFAVSIYRLDKDTVVWWWCCPWQWWLRLCHGQGYCGHYRGIQRFLICYTVEPPLSRPLLSRHLHCPGSPNQLLYVASSCVESVDPLDPLTYKTKCHICNSF